MIERSSKVSLDANKKFSIDMDGNIVFHEGATWNHKSEYSEPLKRTIKYHSEMVRPSQFVFPYHAQRIAKPSRVKNLSGNKYCSKHLRHQPILSKRVLPDGTVVYRVIDGNGTKEMCLDMQRKGHGDHWDSPMECKVYEGLTDEEESALFELENGIRTTVTAEDHYHVGLNSCLPEDQKYRDMEKILSKYRITGDYLNDATSEVFLIPKIATYVKIYVEAGPEVFEKTVAFIRKTFPKNMDIERVPHMYTFLHVLCFFFCYFPNFSPSLLSKVVRKIGWGRIEERVAQYDHDLKKEDLENGASTSTHNREGRYALGVAYFYNKELSGSSNARININALRKTTIKKAGAFLRKQIELVVRKDRAA